MEIRVEFRFRDNVHWCCAIIDSSEYPCYLFIMLKTPELIIEFGNEITIATNGKVLVPRKDDYPELVKLSAAILNAVKEAAEFIMVKIKMKILKPRILENLN